MRTIKSVIIVTNAGQVEGVFTSFRAVKWGKPHKYRRGI